MKIQIINDRERIGDFLATIPAMMKLSENHDVFLTVHPGLQELAQLLPYQIKLGTIENPERTYIIDINAAYATGWEAGLHMTQAYYPQFELPIPESPQRPLLIVPNEDVPIYDFVIAPYAMSLPWGQLWTIEKWNQLIEYYPDKKFALLAGPNDSRFFNHTNLTQYHGESWIKVANLISKAKTVITVVTGLSHLAHALDARHVLFINQPEWAQNQNAIAQLTDFLINEIPLSCLTDVIEGNLKGKIGTGNYIIA